MFNKTMSAELSLERQKDLEWTFESDELHKLSTEIDEIVANKNDRWTYNEPKKRRWSVRRNVEQWSKREITEIGLGGETSGGTWHHLMEVYRIRNVDNGKLLNVGISIDVFEKEQGTSNRNINYSLRTDGKISDGWGGGYYGERDQIENDLKMMNALALRKEDLPKEIDVVKTAEALLANFIEGKFLPPSFVLPEKTSPAVMKEISGKSSRLKASMRELLIKIRKPKT